MRAKSCTRQVVFGVSLLVAINISGVRAAEYGTGPWVKGYTDIFGGVLPFQPGWYSRTDVYHYEGNANTTIFNGRIATDVDENYTATLLALNYVTPWKILGGTYAVAVVPSMLAMDVDVGIQIPAFTGPRGNSFGPFDLNAGDTALAQGDTAFSPMILGWDSGNFHWNIGVFGFAPTGEYDKKDLANTSLNHWAIMSRLAATYFDPKTGWEATGAAIYSVNWENPATDYETGNILNLEGGPETGYLKSSAKSVWGVGKQDWPINIEVGLDVVRQYVVYGSVIRRSRFCVLKYDPPLAGLSHEGLPNLEGSEIPEADGTKRKQRNHQAVAHHNCSLEPTSFRSLSASRINVRPASTSRSGATIRAKSSFGRSSNARSFPISASQAKSR